MPTAGIDWIRNPIAAPLKCLVGELRKQNHEGYFKEKGKQALQAAHDLFPIGVEFVGEKLYTGKQTFAETLAWRAKAYDDGGESKRFEIGTPATLEFIQDRIKSQKPFDPEDLSEVRAKVLSLKFKNCHGVYLLQHPEMINEVYIGKTNNLGGSRPTHRDGKIMVACWSTLPGAQGMLEAWLFDKVRCHELLKDKYKKGTGQFHFINGVDAALIVKAIAAKITCHFNTRKENEICQSNGTSNQARIEMIKRQEGRYQSHFAKSLL